jgi:TetR/AcrR family transcriptional regulator, cholesterol catabolism regulator
MSSPASSSPAAESDQGLDLTRLVMGDDRSIEIPPAAALVDGELERHNGHITGAGGWHSYHQLMPRRSTGPDATDSKSQRTRSRILDAAAHVLSVKGYAGTRLSDVAEYAELRAPAIYYYFSSREILIEEVMFVGIADMRRYLQEELDALPADTSPIDRIMAAVSSHLRHELELSDYTRATIRNSGQMPEHLQARQKKEQTAYNRIWRGLIDNAIADGQIRADLDAPLVQALILGALNWAAEWWDPRRSSVEAMVANAEVFVRHALSPAPRPPKPAKATKASKTAKAAKARPSRPAKAATRR